MLVYLSLLAVSLSPLIAAAVNVKPEVNRRFLVPFSAGSFIGLSLLHILPETRADLLYLVPAGFGFFFLAEKYIWRHCHKKTCRIHPVTALTLFGDAIHGLIDGMVVASGYAGGFGKAATLAVASHAVPQQLANYSVLISKGVTRLRAVALNLASSLSVLIGGLLYLNFSADLSFVAPFAAGGFLYISLTDLLAKGRPEPLLAGLGLMAALKVFF